MKDKRDQDRGSWAEQIGPCLLEVDVARLLGLSQGQVADDSGLLRLTNRDGQRVYPTFQFVPGSRRTLPFLHEVLLTLSGVLPLTAASWLSTAQTDLDGRTPVTALLEGDHAPVLRLAAGVAQSLSA